MDDWFTKTLLKWYKTHQRDLPWRRENDPYKIWLSEIILQQTQVKQGLSYYLAFTAAFPEVQDLAKAPEDKVLKLWQGLGYYSRARNLHASAKLIVQHYGGRFPSTYEELLTLKGVGEYTAAAIASFAFHLPHAVVDGNVYRFLSRLFAIETPIDSGQARKQFTQLANQLLDKRRPGPFNQAIMEFGSQWCKPQRPDCRQCVFNTRCLAFQTGSVDRYPVKIKKTKVKKRHFHYLVLADKTGRFLIQKRDKKDIWLGLYEFPLIETDVAAEPDTLFSSQAFKALRIKNFSLVSTSGVYLHQLSHQQLHAVFFVLSVRTLPALPGTIKTSRNQLKKYAFPRLIDKFLDSEGLKEII